jgi:hypothetical protein
MYKMCLSRPLESNLERCIFNKPFGILQDSSSLLIAPHGHSGGSTEIPERHPHFISSGGCRVAEHWVDETSRAGRRGYLGNVEVCWTPLVAVGQSSAGRRWYLVDRHFCTSLVAVGRGMCREELRYSEIRTSSIYLIIPI